MKKMLTAPVQVWQLVVLAVIMLFGLTGAVVAAAPLANGFWANGTKNMAAVSDSANNPIDVPQNSETAVLSKTITIPAGKVADLAVFGAVDMEAGTASGYQYCFGEYTLDSTSGTVFKPGNYILQGFNPPENNLTAPIDGFLTNVSAGTHTVYMTRSASFADCTALYRSMVIIANIH